MQVTGLLLAKLKELTESALNKPGPDCSAPSYFPDSEQKSVTNAAQTASLNCQPHMNETTAVTLASTGLPDPEGP